MKTLPRFGLLLLMAFFLAVLPGAGTNPWTNQFVWWVDEANSSGVANDNNSCATQGAPCRTFREVSRRLGGPYTSLLGVGTAYIFHLMSSNVGLNHQIIFSPFVGNATLVSFEGVLTQVGSTCTLSAVTLRNTAANVGTQTQISATCPTAAGQMITNATHSSTAWVKSGTSPNWVVTQPLTPCSTSLNICNRQEVNTWAIGDSISVWTLPAEEIEYVAVPNAGAGGGATGFTHVSIAGGGDIIKGAFPALWESRQQSSTNLEVDGVWPEFVNYYQPPGAGSLVAHATVSPSPNTVFKGLVPAFEGGILQINGDVEGYNFALGADLEADATVSGTFADVYLGPPNANGNGINLAPSQQNLVDSAGGPIGFFWGPGGLNLMPGAVLAYPVTHASTIFLNGAVSIGGQGYAVWPGNEDLHVPQGATALWCATNTGGSNPVATNCGIAGIGANMETAVTGGGCGGACWFPGGYAVVSFSLN